MTKTLTKPIKWHGGKDYLADWIISHMPPHTHYVEPYFGGGSVLLRKDPEGVSEVANDIYSELANLWAVLRSPTEVAALHRYLDATPLSEAMFEACDPPNSGSPIDRAYRFFIRARQSRQGLMKDFATLSRNRTRRGMNEQVSSWLTAIEGLPEVHERIKRVVIYNKPALDVINQQDGPNTLFYLDPPYLHETRATTSDYAHEMTERDHADLLETLATIEGKFLLSGYPSTLYALAAERHGWYSVYRDIDNKASSAKVKEKKRETLWANYELGGED